MNCYVNPIIINSPYTGEPIKPRIRTTEDNTTITKEAIWVCPSSGEFIKRGIVSREQKVNIHPQEVDDEF